MLIHADPGRRECSLLASSAETRNPPDAMLWLHWHLLATTTATNAWGNWTMQMPTKIVDHTPDESFHPINSFKYLILSNLCQALLKCLCTFSCFWAANPPPLSGPPRVRNPVGPLCPTSQNTRSPSPPHVSSIQQRTPVAWISQMLY